MIAQISRLLDDAVFAGAFPAAQACVIASGETVHLSAHGAIPGGPTTGRTLFDVASLTKVMATTSLAYALLSRGAIDLDDRIIRWLPELAGSRKVEIRIRHLLAHSSGLPAWRPHFLEPLDPSVPGSPRVVDEVEEARLGLRLEAEARRKLNGGAARPNPAAVADPLPRRHATHPPLRATDAASRLEGCRRRILDLAAAEPLERHPGEGRAYSDLGFILLGELLARAAGAPPDRSCAGTIFAPLGLAHTGFRPLGAGGGAAMPADVAPTGGRRPRPPAPGQEAFFQAQVRGEAESAPGEVDDDNAWAMGGVAGHAGVFSTAADVARWGAAILEERAGAGRLGDPRALEELLRPDPTPGPPRALGFDLPSGDDSSVGRRFGRTGPLGAAGHLGFTGCSVWIDFDRRVVVALLTNRVLPDRANVAGIRAARQALHEAVIDALPK